MALREICNYLDIEIALWLQREFCWKMQLHRLTKWFLASLLGTENRWDVFILFGVPPHYPSLLSVTRGGLLPVWTCPTWPHLFPLTLIFAFSSFYVSHLQDPAAGSPVFCRGRNAASIGGGDTSATSVLWQIQSEWRDLQQPQWRADGW